MSYRNTQSSYTTDYPATRMAIAEPLRDQLSDSEVEQLLLESLPGSDPELVENFFRTLQRFGRQAAPTLQRVLPGVVQGASTGMVAGPWGALIGGLAGGAASALSRPRRPTARPPRARPTPRTRPTPTPKPRRAAIPASPAPTSATPGVPAATAQLLALLSRPETMQALTSLLMAQNGRSAIRVGQRQVPAVAFANALAESAAAILDAADSELQVVESTYLYSEDGSARVDVANPAERARVLVQDVLQEGQNDLFDAEEYEEYDDDDSTYGHDFDDNDDAYQELYMEAILDDYESALHGEY